MDEVDFSILQELRKNSRIKLKDLAKKLQVPLSTVYSRIKKMEGEGVIRDYTIKTDWKKLGYMIKAYVVVYFDITRLYDLKIRQRDVLDRVRKIDYVFEADEVTGDGDFILKIRAKDPEHLSQVLELIQALPGIRNTKTYVALSRE